MSKEIAIIHKIPLDTSSKPKMSTMKLYRLAVSMIFLVLLTSCASDVIIPSEGCDDVMVRYDSQDLDVTSVKAIIDQTCSYAGCHDGAGGIGPGNYKNYDGMLKDLESGSFAERVITQKDNPILGMPPDKSVYPQSQQDSLSTTQLEILTCWLEAGFPR